MTALLGLWLAEVAVFGLAWLVGAPGALFGSRSRFRTWSVVVGGLGLVAFLSAAVGVGSVAWVLFAVALASAVAVDVAALLRWRHWHRVKTVRRRFDKELGL